jgi:molybdate transport system ATP-binding protein
VAAPVSLTAELSVDRDGFSLRLDLTAAAGEVVALVGPNGAGKTTALLALAGLLDGGPVVLDGRRVDLLPPERRDVGWVPAGGLLLPHLSALDNVAYGLRARRTGRREARRRAREELDRLGVADLADRRPRELSGGQAQRVALARALAPDPALLLLDEPLSALDAQVRGTVRQQLRDRLTTTRAPVVLVTHDLADAEVLADHVVVLDRGRVLQSGRIAELRARPAEGYVRSLVGATSTGLGWPSLPG